MLHVIVFIRKRFRITYFLFYLFLVIDIVLNNLETDNKPDDEKLTNNDDYKYNLYCRLNFLNSSMNIPMPIPPVTIRITTAKQSAKCGKGRRETSK